MVLSKAICYTVTLLLLLGPAYVSCDDSENIHVVFGETPDCIAPLCGDFTFNYEHVADSLTGFRAGYTDVDTVNDYGSFWSTYYDIIGSSVDENFGLCSKPDKYAKKATSTPYSGVKFYTHYDSNRYFKLQSDSVPHHDIEDYCSAQGGELPPLIGTTSGETFSWDITCEPSNTYRSDISNTVGVMVNGVAIYSPFTFISTLAAEDETLDTCNGHPANGQYHYHGFSPCVHDETVPSSDPAHSEIYGWAHDGFPIYGPYGYEDPFDDSSDIVRIVTGYSFTGTTDTERTKPAFWEYSAEGDLDECNGRYTKTPQFPDGMYVYVLNVDDEGNPEFPGVPYCVQTSSPSV